MAGNNIIQKDREAFKFMLHLDIHRGKDSTGVAIVNAQGNWDLIKRAGNAWDLFGLKAFDDIMRYGGRYAYIGHNRAATKGKVNNINAHPFEMADVVGAHNGTIRGQHRLIDNTDFEVDSENIFHSIQEIGVNQTLDVLDGAYALSYWDKRDSQLVLLRNNERPLWFCFSEDYRNVYWASEKWILTVALSRNSIKHTEVEPIEPGSIYRFNFELKFNGGPITYTQEAFVPFVPPKTATNVYRSGSNKGQGQQSNGSPKQSLIPKETLNPSLYVHREVTFLVKGERTGGHYGSTYIEAEEMEENLELRIPVLNRGDLIDELLDNKDIIWKGIISSYGKYAGNKTFYNINPRSVEELVDDDIDVFLGFRDRILEEKEWRDKTEKGCAWCSDIPFPDAAPDLHWVSDDTFVCEECQKTDEVKSYIGHIS